MEQDGDSEVRELIARVPCETIATDKLGGDQWKKCDSRMDGIASKLNRVKHAIIDFVVPRSKRVGDRRRERSLPTPSSCNRSRSRIECSRGRVSALERGYTRRSVN